MILPYITIKNILLRGSVCEKTFARKADKGAKPQNSFAPSKVQLKKTFKKQIPIFNKNNAAKNCKHYCKYPKTKCG